MSDDSTGTTEIAPTIRRRRLTTLRRIGWPVVYAVTVILIFGWYELIRPVAFTRQIQGSWCEVEGEFAGEKFTDVHLRIEGDETWRTYPRDDSWQILRSRVSIRPSHEFFHVTREYGFDWGRNTRTTDYFIYKRNDQLFVLRGLASLDPVGAPVVQKLRRVDDMPDGAEEAIATYLEKYPED